MESDPTRKNHGPIRNHGPTEPVPPMRKSSEGWALPVRRIPAAGGRPATRAPSCRKNHGRSETTDRQSRSLRRENLGGMGSARPKNPRGGRSSCSEGAILPKNCGTDPKSRTDRAGPSDAKLTEGWAPPVRRIPTAGGRPATPTPSCRKTTDRRSRSLRRENLGGMGSARPKNGHGARSSCSEGAILPKKCGTDPKPRTDGAGPSDAQSTDTAFWKIGYLTINYS
jgi:hypothetical protein